jgi:hypothetical protein
MLLFLCLATGLRADQVEMQNGDRYSGKVLSLTPDKLVLQSEVLGKVTLPRARVALVTVGTNAATSLPPAAAQTNNVFNAPNLSVASTNANPDLSSALRSLGANTNFIQQVRGQFLDGAGPEANKKFDDLLQGMMSGKLNVNDIRAEAKSSADQLRALKRDLGPEAGESLDMYLEILDSFLKETASAPAAGPSGSPARSKATAGSLNE